MNKRMALWLGCCAWIVLSGTTPGSVGSCGGDELAEPTPFREYCQRREELTCVRRFLRMEITEETRDSCRWDAVDACARRSFTDSCRPTRRETDACLRALASFDTLDTQETELSECTTATLCKATPSEQPPSDFNGGAAGSESN